MYLYIFFNFEFNRDTEKQQDSLGRLTWHTTESTWDQRKKGDNPSSDCMGTGWGVAQWQSTYLASARSQV